MKVLKVYGDDDFAALEFEQYLEKEGKTLLDCYDECLETSSPITIEGLNVTYEAVEFGEVDKEFVTFVRDYMDYDSMKNSNFYVVEY